MDDDMPDFQDDAEKEDLLLGDEDDIEAGLQAAFDEEEAHEAPSSGEKAAAAEVGRLSGDASAAQVQQQAAAAGAAAVPAQQQQQQQAQPQQQVPQADQPLPLTAEGFVDLERLTADQRHKVTNTIVGLMTEEQLDRYEAFRRSSLKRPMRTLVKTVTGSSANPNDKLMIAVSSVAKTFVGDLVEAARLVATERGEEGPLQPLHIHAAYQRLRDQGKLPAKPGLKKRPFV